MDRRDGDPDLLETGSADASPRRLGPWPLRIAAAAVAGLVVGYVVGAHTGGSRTDRSAATASPSPSLSPSPSSTTAPAPVTGPVFAPTGATCSQQHGHDLELGVQVQNFSASVVHVISVRPRAPVAGGLRLRGAHVGVCSENSGLPVSVDAAAVLPGATTWLAVTAHVLVKCPAPYPVEFVVRYQRGAHARVMTIRGFNDLAHVPYTGCARPR